jgi:cytoskeletal protein RodZ
MAEARTREMHPKRVGERLAEARAALKLELEDVAERSRIPLRHLQAIENSDFGALPASTYSVGFAKTFARMVGLDGEEIATAFRAERGETLAQRLEYTPFEPADPSRVPPSLLVTIALGTAIVLLIAYLVWRGGGATEERQQIAAGTKPEISAPTPSAPAQRQTVVPTARPQPPAPAATDKVVLVASDTVWLKVSERGGTTLYMGELAPGQRYEVPTNAKDPVLLTGRPHVLSAQVGAYRVASLGSAKRSISNVSLKGPALIEREAAMKPALEEEARRSATANPDQATAPVATPSTP